MALISSIDPVNRDIFLSIDTVGASINPIDIYKEMRALRKSDENLRPFDVFLSGFGNVAKGGGKFTERYVVQNSGTRIIPYDVSHELTVIGTIITDDGQEGVACFDRSPLSPTTIVDINYVPPQVEVVRADAELSALVQSAFNNQVVYDSANGFSGTGTNINGDYIGTSKAPSNNLTDAKAICIERGFKNIYINGVETIDGTESLDGYTLIGHNQSQTHITFVGADTGDTSILYATFSGTMNGALYAKDCTIGDVSGIGCTTNSTNIINCLFSGNLTLRADNVKPLNIINSGSINNAIMVLDINGTSGGITIHSYNDRIKFTNMTVAVTVHITGEGCELEADALCTAGFLEIHGDVNFTNNSTIPIIDNDSLNTLLKHIERGVWIDTEQISVGDGSQGNPFNSLTTAIDYAEEQGIKTLYIYADILIDRLLKNFKVIGVGTPTIDCNGQDLNRSEFSRCKIEGSYIGAIIVQESVLLNNFWLNGYFEGNGLAGNLFCVDGGEVFLKNNASAISGLGRPTISMNIAGSTKLSVRGNGGGLTIKDCNNALDEVTIEVAEGSLTFDSSNDLKFDGQMVARGSGNFVDETTGFSVSNQMQTKVTWQEVVEAGFSAEEMMRIIASMAASKVSGMENDAPVFRDINDTKDRITAVTDANGNRLSVILDAT